MRSWEGVRSRKVCRAESPLRPFAFLGPVLFSKWNLNALGEAYAPVIPALTLSSLATLP